jgi:hypothetical protein
MWISQWRAISARISGLHRAADFWALMSSEQRRDYESRSANSLIDHANRIGESLRCFFDQFGRVLPDQASSSLEQFCQPRRAGGLFGNTSAHLPASDLLPAVSLLLSFQAEFEYLVSDNESVTKSLVARSLTHLQSSIVADPRTRESWVNAFDTDEPACERLGASHLLLHGVWSFKASTPNARTDLVLGEPRINWDEPRRAAQGLVLTEWKRVTIPGEIIKMADEALTQAKLYSEQPLGGFEVASTRYLILVSRKRLPMPEALVENNVTYEYRNVAVHPDTPSVEARKAAHNGNSALA